MPTAAIIQCRTIFALLFKVRRGKIVYESGCISQLQEQIITVRSFESDVNESIRYQIKNCNFPVRAFAWFKLLVSSSAAFCCFNSVLPLFLSLCLHILNKYGRVRACAFWFHKFKLRTEYRRTVSKLCKYATDSDSLWFCNF